MDGRVGGPWDGGLSSGCRVGGSSWGRLRELTRWRHFFNSLGFAFGFCQKRMFQESW